MSNLRIYNTFKTIFGNLNILIENHKICEINFNSEYSPKTISNQKTFEFDIRKIFSPDNLDIPIKFIGTEFQIKVWQAVRTIPFGKTVSYNDIANLIHQPKAIRAVANAIAQNKLAYLVPCHRIIKKTGAIHKYRWGNDLKVKLLDWEKNHIENNLDMRSELLSNS